MWLSKEAQISEYVALQLVVQEWQNRPTFQLLSGLTEEEALSVQAAAGITNLGASTFNPNSSILSTPLTDKATQFDSQAQRRLRIIETYHTTCASILRISQLLVSWGAAPSLRSQTIYSKDYHSDCAGWIEDLGQTVTSSSVKGKVVEPGAQVLDECLKAVQKRCEAVGAGYVWTVDESIIEAAAETWVVAQSTEILHLLHLALTHADLVHKRFLPAASIEDWLKFFMQVGFFRDIAIVCSEC